jgi:hypothetical protein
MGTPGRLPTVTTYPSAVQQTAFYGNAPPVFGNNITFGAQPFASANHSNINNSYRNPSHIF